MNEAAEIFQRVQTWKLQNKPVTPDFTVEKSAYFSCEWESARVSCSFLPGYERSTDGGVDLQRLEAAAAATRSEQPATQRRPLRVHRTQTVICPLRHRRAAPLTAGLGLSTRYRPMSEDGSGEADKWARLRGDNVRRLGSRWVQQRWFSPGSNGGGVPDLVQEESQGAFNPQTLACSEDVRTEDRDLLEVDFCWSLEVIEVAVCEMLRVGVSLWVRVSLWFSVNLWVFVPSPSFRRVKTFLCKLSTTEKEKTCRLGRWWLKEEQVDGKNNH